MKVKCLKCGFIYEMSGTGDEMCPKCGCRHWSMNCGQEKKEKIDRESLEMVENLIGEAYNMAKGFLAEKGHMYSEKMGVPYTMTEAKILQLRAITLDMLKQMNKDYRDLIEKHLFADLPIDPIEISKLYQAQLERINNIKI